MYVHYYNVTSISYVCSLLNVAKISYCIVSMKYPQMKSFPFLIYWNRGALEVGDVDVDEPLSTR